MSEIERLISSLENPLYLESDLRWQACKELGMASNTQLRDKIIKVLIQQLRPPNCAVVRATAAEALGCLCAKEALIELLETLNDVHHLPRAYAVDALVLLGEEAAILPLIEVAMNDSNRGARAAAVNGLKTICKDKTSDACQRALEVVRESPEREKARREKEGTDACKGVYRPYEFGGTLVFGEKKDEKPSPKGPKR